jgi:hypothetical protein
VHDRQLVINEAEATTARHAIEEAGLDSSRIAPLLKSAAARSERLQVEQDNALSSLIDRVDLDEGGMQLSIKLPLSNAESAAPDGSGHLSLKRHVPPAAQAAVIRF